MSDQSAAGGSDRCIECKLVFSLSRRHGWGNPIPKDDLVSVLPSSDQGRGKEICDQLKYRSYISFQQSRGFSIKSSPDEQAKIAYFLVGCGYSRLQIETTLSRFDDVGGFDTYDEPP